MSYLFSDIEFGLPVRTDCEKELGSISERNLRELFRGSSDIKVPDQRVGFRTNDPDQRVGYRAWTGLPYASNFGLHAVGCAEYMPYSYVMRIHSFNKRDVLPLAPDKIECYFPDLTLCDLAVAIKVAKANWFWLLNRVQPTPLLWSYLTLYGAQENPMLMQMTPRLVGASDNALRLFPRRFPTIWDSVLQASNGK